MKINLVIPRNSTHTPRSQCVKYNSESLEKELKKVSSRKINNSVIVDQKTFGSIIQMSVLSILGGFCAIKPTKNAWKSFLMLITPDRLIAINNNRTISNTAFYNK